MSASKCCVEPDGMKRCCTWGQVRGEVRVAVWSPLGCSAQSHHYEQRQWLHPQLWQEHLCTAHAKTYGTCTIHMRKRYQTPTDTYRKKHACLPQTQTHTHTHTGTAGLVWTYKQWEFFICIKSAFICASLEEDVFLYLWLSWWRNDRGISFIIFCIFSVCASKMSL